MLFLRYSRRSPQKAHRGACHPRDTVLRSKVAKAHTGHSGAPQRGRVVALSLTSSQEPPEGSQRGLSSEGYSCSEDVKARTGHSGASERGSYGRPFSGVAAGASRRLTEALSIRGVLVLRSKGAKARTRHYGASERDSYGHPFSGIAVGAPRRLAEGFPIRRVQFCVRRT